MRKALLMFAAAGAAAAAGWWLIGRARPQPLQGIVLVTIDTLRADRLDPGTMPHLSRFASNARVFTHARTTAPLTLPAHASIMTGLLPPEHGARENGVVMDGAHLRLAALLRQAGFRTGAFVSAFVLDRRFGLAEGFDVYDDEIARDPQAALRLEAERSGAITIDRAIAWVHQSGSPFFLWVHLFEPHAPYPGGYDRDVMDADTQVGRLIDTIASTHDDQHIAWVIAGDHGEALGSHGEATHGMLLYDAVLRVPLIVRGPDLAGGTNDTPVSSIDIAPTLLRWAGLDVPSAMQGIDLRESAGRDRDVYSETMYPQAAGWHGLAALSGPRWKVIRSSATELYDVASDPDEARDLARAQGQTAAAMASAAAAIAGRAPGKAGASAPEVRERLRALGYVSGGTPAQPASNAPNPASEIASWVEFERALSVIAAGRARDALDSLAGLAARYPEGRVFHATYARALQDSGEPARALEIYRDLVKRSPPDAMLFHDLAAAARAAGDAAEALRAEQAALALDPRNAAALNGVGLVHADAGRAAEAAGAFEQAAARDSRNPSYWTNLGNARRSLGNLAGAADAYQRALDASADFADALNGLGAIRVQTGRAAEAIGLFERVLARDPGHIEARLNLGIALQESGRMAEAVAAYRDVLARAKPGTREHDAATALLRDRR